MKIKVGNESLSSKDIEELINHILIYAKTAANEYESDNSFSQGVAQAYTEILDSIHNWGIIKEAKLSRNLERWAEKNLA